VQSSVEIIFIFAEQEVKDVASTIPQLLNPQYLFSKIIFYNRIWQNIRQILNRFPGLLLLTIWRVIGNAIQTRSQGNIEMRNYLCGFFQWVLDEFNYNQAQAGLSITEPFSFIEWVNRPPTPSPRFSRHSARFSRPA
jgi:hypothetical protein